MPVIVTVDSLKVGLSICYDVRFPHLYRQLATDGAQLIMVPAAFTATSGAAHWHVPSGARAIETGCFISGTGTIRGPCGRAAYLWPFIDYRPVG